jgi:hypothetical protein
MQKGYKVLYFICRLLALSKPKLKCYFAKDKRTSLPPKSKGAIIKAEKEFYDVTVGTQGQPV